LAGILFLTDLINPVDKNPWVDDFFRSVVFISVSIITIILSEQIEKSRILLENSEKKFRSVVESAIEAIITADESGRVIFVNKSFEKIFGYRQDEIIGKTFEIIIPPQYRDKHAKIFNKFNEKSKDEYYNKTLELTALRKDGTEFPFEMSITSWEVNDQTFITAILRDISERKEAEKTQNILSAIVNGSDDAIIGKDLEGNILSWNRGAEIIYGYKAEKVIGKSISIIFLPNSDELSQELQQISNGKSIKHYETKRVTKQGDIIDISLTVSVIKDFRGKIIGVSSIGRDITHEKKVKAALAKSEAQLNMVTSNMADIISQSSSDGSYIYVSPSIKQVMGYEPQEVIGKSILDFIHPDDVEYVSSCMMRAVNEGTIQSSQHRHRTADGSYIWIETLGTPLYNRKKDTVPNKKIWKMHYGKVKKSTDPLLNQQKTLLL
jgi:PAS domain S-box-containing protein